MGESAAWGGGQLLTNSHLTRDRDGATRMGGVDQQRAGRGVHSPASSLLAAAAHSGSSHFGSHALFVFSGCHLDFASAAYGSGCTVFSRHCSSDLGSKY